MRYREKKKLKGTLTDHSDRLENLEETLHTERLSKWLLRSFIGFLMIMGSAYHDLIAAFLVKTRFFSYTYNSDFGRGQALVMLLGGALLVFSAIKYDKERSAQI